MTQGRLASVFNCLHGASISHVEQCNRADQKTTFYTISLLFFSVVLTAFEFISDNTIWKG